MEQASDEKTKETTTKATIIVDNETWKEFKKLAIDKEMRISELLQELVSSYLKKNGKNKK